jgi:hypothetical protein
LKLRIPMRDREEHLNYVLMIPLANRYPRAEEPILGV